ncbi:glycosyltransferase [Flavobacterium sp. CAN_S2]|uniref:glycosyltransferase n=1 Tax=Flavobacterium sp. CAN_S2 TaxID=2787726 RepID=UPI0018C90F92
MSKNKLEINSELEITGTQVSVVMITYGHEKYIAEAINGVFMQENDFQVELIIANDCSPDGTDEVVKKLLYKAPANVTVKYTRHGKNLGMMPNFIWALQQAKGKYIALCEGDDYWTDPLKLQKQVDFLEQNKTFILTSHHRSIVDENNKKLSNSEYQEIGYFTQCILFKNVLLNDFLSFDSSKINNGDTFLMVYLMNFGDFNILNFVGSAYRVSEVGVWSLNDINKKYSKSFISYTFMISFFAQYNYKKSLQIIKNYKIDNYIRYSIRLKQNNELPKSIYFLLLYVVNFCYYGKISKSNIKTAIKYFI